MSRKVRLIAVVGLCTIILSTGLLGVLLGPDSANVPRVAAGGAPPPGSGPLTVEGFVRVYDGDTVEVQMHGTRMVLGVIGIDAPEGNTACGQQAAGMMWQL